MDCRRLEWQEEISGGMGVSGKKESLRTAGFFIPLENRVL